MTEVRRPFGKGAPVSLFTLGTMRALESTEQMYQVVKTAVLCGINHVETAPSYGPAENFLGKVLAQLKEEETEPEGGWIVTSKILPGANLEAAKHQILSQLQRLSLPKIHNLAIHGLNLPDHLEWAQKGEGADLIHWAKNEGLVEQIGFSSHGSNSLIEEAISNKEFTFCSLHLHLFDPYRLPLAQIALSKGMGVMAISPADKGGHLHTPTQTLMKDCSPIHPLKLAYRFLLSNGISTLTVGASKAEDLLLAEQLKNADSPLNINETNVLRELQRKAKLRLGNSQCGQCRKCLPCPKEIPIPELLRLRNLAIGQDLMSFAKERYNLIGRAGHWWEKINATACENCGDCLPRCPHQLPIPELLNETHKILVDTPKRRLWS